MVDLDESRWTQPDHCIQVNAPGAESYIIMRLYVEDGLLCCSDLTVLKDHIHRDSSKTTVEISQRNYSAEKSQRNPTYNVITSKVLGFMKSRIIPQESSQTDLPLHTGNSVSETRALFKAEI
ncbi:hypothetical protein T11_13456 [Trichinella zimbabwensis]|uniref:Uncharacterized protein n=1 Tax=Trichinella zimbabwensis TaxID=268475 RepID=A0A0V1GXP2_9BILA|nr:hypothetical protein T11_13456 [Trichinella zimbabwensis]